ncbi:hypothetical protein SAMN06298216_2412 [Spirosomataceae bacterium TFI 002]|nr:hypothetical protein SAMN06298216_2412 [Spirosomataceae bacterium TFI 002]
MKKENYSQTILSIVVGFIVLYWIFDKEWLFYIASVVGVLGLLSTTFAKYIEIGWLKIAEVMGRINATILLSLIFFIFLTPIALLMKIIKGGDQLKLKKQSDSVFVDRNHTYTAKDMTNIW